MPEAVVNDVRVHYQRAGSADSDATVVMIHGLVIDNLSSLYYALAPGVADRMDVLLYDLRGHGRTSRPATGYGVGRAVDDLWALLDHLGIDRPVYLLGNSYGGTIALEAARRDPERVRGLVLVETHVPVPGWAEHISAQLELAGFGLSQVDLSEWLAGRPGRKIASLVRTLDGLVNDTSIVEDLARSEAMDSHDLAAIQCPAYALYGEFSDVIDRASMLEAALPRCELDILGDCSHSAMMEAPMTMRRLIADWFARVQRGEDVPGRTRRVEPGTDEGDGAANRREVDRFLDEMQARREAALAGVASGGDATEAVP